MMTKKKQKKKLTATERAEQVLVEFKLLDAAAAECALVLTHDERLQRLVIVWPSVVLDVMPPPLGTAPPAAQAARWLWLWSGVTFDERTLANALAVDRATAALTFESARAAHLIYPDNTVNRHATAMLRALVLERLPRARRTPDSA